MPPLFQERGATAVVQVQADPCDCLLTPGIPRQCINVQEKGPTASTGPGCESYC